MSYHLKLQEFEGPLDLLLHLIKKEEAELDKISLSKITDQYLAYIDGLAELDLDQASEFVLLAATLLQLKARSVLPRPAVVSEDLEEEPVEWLSGPGSEAELAERLNVYRQFKQIAEHLQDREETWSRVYTRSALNEALGEGFSASASTPAGSISIATLCNAFQKILDNLETPEPYLELTRDQVTIMEQMRYILERLVAAGAGTGANEGDGADVGAGAGVNMGEGVTVGAGADVRTGADTEAGTGVGDGADVGVNMGVDVVAGAGAGAGKSVTFNSLFSQLSTRGEIVVTFLALLELIRCQQVRVIQEKALGPILVEPAAGFLGAAFSADFNGADYA